MQVHITEQSAWPQNIHTIGTGHVGMYFLWSFQNVQAHLFVHAEADEAQAVANQQFPVFQLQRHHCLPPGPAVLLLPSCAPLQRWSSAQPCCAALECTGAACQLCCKADRVHSNLCAMPASATLSRLVDSRPQKQAQKQSLQHSYPPPSAAGWWSADAASMGMHGLP